MLQDQIENQDLKVMVIQINLIIHHLLLWYVFVH